MCEPVPESSIKSLNHDLVKSVQAMKANIQEYKTEMNNLNEIILNERMKYAFDLQKMRNAFKGHMKLVFENAIHFLTTFDPQEPPDTEEKNVCIQNKTTYDSSWYFFLFLHFP